MSLTNQDKRNIVCELRGIAQDIDIEFEHMILYGSVCPEKVQQIDVNLNNILSLIVMYKKAISLMQTDC
jgi:hypothetical protein